MHRYRKISFVVLALAAAGTAAYAANGVFENDALAGNHAATHASTPAKISLLQAVTTAEQAAHGHAVRAEYEDSKQGWVYEVEIVSGAQVFDVRVDAEKGGVISSAEDKADRDDDHDAKD